MRAAGPVKIECRDGWHVQHGTGAWRRGKMPRGNWASGLWTAEYSNRMKLRQIMRRMVGGVLAALLSLSMGLPARCGACRGEAAKVDCAEQHGAAAEGPGAGAVTDAWPCDSCGVKSLSVATGSHSTHEAWHVLPGCGEMSCSEFARQAFAQLVRGGATERAERTGAGTRPPAKRETIGIARIDFPLRHQNILSFCHELSPCSSYHPLSVSLKI